jgi:hypothetical protein
MPATRQPYNPGVAVERSDAPPRLIAILGAGLAAFLVVAALALALIYPNALSGPSDAPRLTTAAPRLQINPPGDLAVHRAAEQRELAGYGWVDRQRGTVRIPIEQAMRDIAASGIKDWPGDAR